MRSSLQPGMTLQGRYKILKCIGSGGMGYVFKAHALRLNKECALKEMQDHFLDPEERAKIAAQFRNEAQTLAKLDHPGIPHILDTFEENEKHYLVMEFVDGHTLEEIVINTPEFFTQDQVLGWLHQIIDILSYLHNLPEPVIIRDLKPANIMLSEDGKIKIIDFGIAKIFESNSSHTMTRIKGSGSSGFAPPEQYGSTGTDARSDIYSLGVTLYYLMTRLILPDSVDRILSGGILEPMASYNATATEPMEALVKKMVQLKPEDRFQNINELIQFINENELTGADIPIEIAKRQTIIPSAFSREEKARQVDAWSSPKATSAPLPPAKLTAEDLGLKRNISLPSQTKNQASLIREASEMETKRKLTEEPPQEKTAYLDPVSHERRPRYMAEAMLSKTQAITNEKQNNKSNAAGIITSILIILFLAVAAFLVHYYMKYMMPTPKPPQPSPTPTISAPPAPPPKPYELKKINGEIITIEVQKTNLKLRVKSSEGYVSFLLAKEKFNKKLKAAALVSIVFRVPKDSAKAIPPWVIDSITVTKEAPAKIKPPPITPSKPAYTPPARTYTPPARTYTPPARTYTPPARTYAPPPPPRTYAPPPPKEPAHTSTGGSFTQKRPEY